jgi:hypothetical protein
MRASRGCICSASSRHQLAQSVLPAATCARLQAGARASLEREPAATGCHEAPGTVRLEALTPCLLLAVNPKTLNSARRQAARGAALQRRRRRRPAAGPQRARRAAAERDE